MRPQDRAAFIAAARHFQCWILVRRTNADSLKYVGRPGYVPKPIHCKAKTADLDTADFRNRRPRRAAGLVASPELLPNVFKPGKLGEAERCWKKFLADYPGPENGRPGRPFGLDTDENSPHYGCVTLNGAYIHGDYDLYDVVLVSNPRSNLAAIEELHGAPHRRGARVAPVQRFVNRIIGVPMVQHGGQAQFAAHSNETLDVFCPDGSTFELVGRGPIRRQYHKWKRQTLE